MPPYRTRRWGLSPRSSHTTLRITSITIPGGTTTLAYSPTTGLLDRIDAPGGRSLFTVDIALDNPEALSVFGVLGSMSGLAAAGAEVTAGQSASAHFTSICIPTQCLDGLPTVDNLNFNPNDLPASENYTPGDDSIPKA